MNTLSMPLDRIAHVLGDPVRVRILDLLAKGRRAEACSSPMRPELRCWVCACDLRPADEMARYAFPSKMRGTSAACSLKTRRARALEADAEQESAKWAATALQIRRGRTPSLSPAARTFETALEMMEGTANYTAIARALGRGVPPDEIRQTLRIVTGIRSQDCFGQAVGPEMVARMEKPLEAARRTLRQSERAPGTAGSSESPAAVR